ncbi:MAG TPA: hypothetical protein DCS05_05215 [Nitrospiraceae bacterium]|nr:hypothetical protein [Nitrospiraceae bacterium]
MNHFERAIIRMEACDAACTELITMAKKDIVELEKRRANARKLIAAWKPMTFPPVHDHHDHFSKTDEAADPEFLRLRSKIDSKIRAIEEHAEAQAREIADREPQTVSCMLVGMKY